MKYVTFDTQSDESTGVTPSTAKQMVFAEYLKSELEALGLEEISLDENGYLFATLPANVNREIPTIGFIAHMDTSPDMSGTNVKPRIVENYDGKPIVLCAEDNIILSPEQFPELLDHVGEDLIVTDGHTLLGADDKAGIAEIVGAMAYLKEHPEIEHGKSESALTPMRKSDWVRISSMLRSLAVSGRIPWTVVKLANWNSKTSMLHRLRYILKDATFIRDMPRIR